jgi:two-component system sensor histidine kinase ChvG
MVFRSIFVKIFIILIVINAALWAFIFLTEDTAYSEINNKRSALYSQGVLVSEIVKPTLLRTDLSRFDKMIEITNTLNQLDTVLSDALEIRPFFIDEVNDDGFAFFQTNNPYRESKIIVSEIISEGPKLAEQPKLPKIAELLFYSYKRLVDFNLLTDPIVYRRARFSAQYHLIEANADGYELRYAMPIKFDKKTIAIVDLKDAYHLREIYLKDNNARLWVLIGLSGITLLIGSVFAFSLAFPLRRLSRRLNKKLTSDDVAQHLTDFRIQSLEKRKDEIGLVYKNLIKLNDNLARIFADKERFAADISHEIKNPVSSIIAHTEVIKGNLNDQEKVQGTITTIQKQAIRINKLVSEISEAATVDHELVAAKREQFNLSVLLNDLVDHFREAKATPGVKIMSDIAPNIQFVGLPDRFAQVVINLIENAISFSRPRGTVTISLKRRWMKDLTLSVEDTGPGIPEEQLDKIFERFFTHREGTAEEDASSGLGLFIVKQVVEAHGGKVSVSNVRQGGAKFSISLKA